jgi:hypothetical protein
MTLPHGFMGSHLSCRRALELSVGAKSCCLRSTASRSAKIFRVTASVARSRLPLDVVE